MSLRRLRSLCVSASSLHSRTVTTIHPWRRSVAADRLSRAVLLAILGAQYEALDRGIDAILHACPCQKHPWTNTATCSLGSTRSGRPARSRLWRRNRNPAPCTALRTASSGFVFTLLIAAILRLRPAVGGIRIIGESVWTDSLADIKLESGGPFPARRFHRCPYEHRRSGLHLAVFAFYGALFGGAFGFGGRLVAVGAVFAWGALRAVDGGADLLHRLR